MSHTGKKKSNWKQQLRTEIREHPVLFSVYLVLRTLVLITLIFQFLNQNYESVLICLLTLVLFLIPSFVERRLHIDLPNTLEVIILIFIFAAEILGEIQEYYLIFPHWDTILHTTNGFLMAAIGFSLVDVLNRSSRFRIRLSPIFVAVVAFCFSMTVGVLWEFFEFGADNLLHTDMQKDTVLQSVTSVMFDPEGRNQAVTLPIESVVVNGERWEYGGYIDIGLYDTMEDLLVNFLGALCFSIIGFFYIKGRGKGKFARRFIPRLKSEELADEPPSELFEPVPIGSEAEEPLALFPKSE